jgi:nicotinamide-nucleotide amidase
MLSAEIIAVGSELLTPEKSDTNGLWLTERLNEIGVEVLQKTIVGDDRERMFDAFKGALERSGIVIITGGLGPTEDDITRVVAAEATGRELIFHSEIEGHLRERFRKWGREMPAINKRQAYIIEGAEMIPNDNGSAPGMFVALEDKYLVILPGPPRENQPMFEGFVRPRLSDAAGDIVVRRRILRVSGMGESAVDEAIAPIYKGYPTVRTAILFSKTEVEVHLYSRASTAEAADRVNDELSKKIEGALGIAVFACNGETMEEVIGRLLRERNETVAVAESCTGGLIGRRLTEVPGSSDYFIEGCVTYSNAAKVRTLAVEQKTLDEFGAVSAETAEAMAVGMRERAGTTYALSVTGIAGPEGGTVEKPVGTVFFGLAGPKGARSNKLVLPGDRYLIRWRASQAALDILRRQVLKRRK